MNSVQLTVPYWSLQLAGAALVALVSGFIALFVVQYVKHRYTLAQLQKMGSLALHTVVLLVASGMTAIDYYTPLLQQNLIVLQHLPYVGGLALGVYTVANFLFATKKQAWFQKWFKTAEKLDKKVNKSTSFDGPVDVPAEDALV